MRVTLVTICLLLLATGALAQSDRGTITGAVNDPNGAVARAEVIVRNVATGTEYKTVTTETGNYTISSLPAGIRIARRGARVQEVRLAESPGSTLADRPR